MRSRAERGQVCILAVGDDPLALRYLHDALTQAGYAAATTADPEEAMDFIELTTPHLVLPGVDGVGLMADILAIPIIFLSACGQEDVVARAFDMGVDASVVKPSSPTELTAWVRLVRRTLSDDDDPTYIFTEPCVNYRMREPEAPGREGSPNV